LEVSVNDITEVEKEVQIQVPAEEVKPKLEEAFREGQAGIEIKGFRKGKAPIGMIKKLFGSSIEQQALTDLANELYRKVVEEKSIQALGEPVMTDMNYKEGENFTFKVKYEVKPVVTLKEYKGIPVERIVRNVDDEDVDEEIANLLRSNSAMTDAEEAAGDNFVVTVDVQELDETDTPIIGKRTEGITADLSSKTIFPEIKAALKGAKIGDVRRAKFDSQHDDHTHKNNLEFTVRKIQRIDLPAFDDAFVAKVTKDKMTNAAEFKAKTRADIEAYFKNQSDAALRDSIVDEIVKRNDLAVPETLVRVFTDSKIEEMRERMPKKTLPKSFDEKKYREEYREYAKGSAKWFLLREAITEAEKLEVSDEELEKQAEKDAPTMGIDKERLLSFYKSSEQMKEKMVSDKLMNFLIANAVVTEKVVAKNEPAPPKPPPPSKLVTA
jgi:trigger factor